MKKIHLVFALAMLALVAAHPARAAVKTQVVDYTIAGATYEGFLAYDDARPGKRPGVLVYHAFFGPSDFERQTAERLAKLGYVAFVADIYGKTVRPKNTKDALAESDKYDHDRALYRVHAKAALDQLLADPHVDKTRIAAIGYCFGGTGALELARAGADLKSVVTFHGVLMTPTPDDAKNIKAHVLVLTGADDPLNPPATVQAFETEMRSGHVDYQVDTYGGAVHCFTLKTTGSDNSKGCAYNAEADKRSWQAMEEFFKETL